MKATLFSVNACLSGRNKKALNPLCLYELAFWTMFVFPAKESNVLLQSEV